MILEEIKNKFSKFFTLTKFFSSITKKYKLILLKLYLKNTILEKYEFIEFPFEKEIINIIWYMPFGISICYKSNINYKLIYESINLEENECNRITNYKITKNKSLLFIYKNKSYDDPSKLCHKIYKNIKIIDNNKEYNCSKYFNFEEILFMMCYPFIFDELVCDNLPINILEYDISNL